MYYPTLIKDVGDMQLCLYFMMFTELFSINFLIHLKNKIKIFIA